MKEIHFFTNYFSALEWYLENAEKYGCPIENIRDFEDGENALRRAEILHDMNAHTYDKAYVATQMCFLTTKWFKYGFRVFVHDKSGMFEIKLGTDNDRTNREIRMSHNLFKMWKEGCFDV